MLFDVHGLHLHFILKASPLGRPLEVLKAVNGVDFSVRTGEILGVVGESGSGKSSIARMLLRLDRPTAGQILYRGQNVLKLAGFALKSFRRDVQAVFQDPYSSLNPRMTIMQVLSEAWRLNPDVLPREAWRGRAVELLEQVGLPPTALEKYPREFSGGECQRIAIARALALKPHLIICDEAVSSLDMSIQAQVLDLLAELRRELGLAYLFIAHDLTLVEKFADRVLVMKKGQIVEKGPARTVFGSPTHAYTRALIAASPVPDPAVQARRRMALVARNESVGNNLRG
jgi:peptide/nickel transport system ATP-binding protein